MAEEKEQPEPTFTNPVKTLAPVLLPSVIAPEPDKVKVEPAVKFEALRFIALVSEMAPARVTDPVVPKVTVPPKVDVPVTDVLVAPDKVKVVPDGTARFAPTITPPGIAQVVLEERLRSPVVDRAPVKVTVPAVFEIVKSEVAFETPVKVTAPAPDMV